MLFPTVVSPLLAVLTEKMDSAKPILEELRLPSDVRKDLEVLPSKLSAVGVLIADAEKMTVVPRDLDRRVWDLRELAFDLDDAMEDFQIEAQRRKSQRRKPTLAGKVRDLLPTLCYLAFRLKMSSKIKDFVTRLDESVNMGFLPTIVTGPYPIPPTVHERNISLREKIWTISRFKRDCVDLLINHENDTNLSALIIWEPRGTGETALARLIYHATEINRHFDILMWLWVGPEFDVHCTSSACTGSADIEFASELLRENHGKRFLLVLDDLRDVTTEALGRLLSMFGGGKLGSKFVVTCRSVEVVDSVMGMENTMVWMSHLSNTDSWWLYKEVSEQKQTPKPLEMEMEIVNKSSGLPLLLEGMEMEIAKKSSGLPSLLEGLGNLMASEVGKSKLLGAQNHQLWRLPEAPSGSLHSLRPSFDNLSPYLRQIFAYFSFLPLDNSIDWLKLNQLWIGEGFIRSSVNNVDGEMKSILHCRRDDLGDIVSWMPNYDLLSFIARDEFLTEIEMGVYHRQRRASVLLDDGWRKTISVVSNEAPKLRSLLVFRQKQYLTKGIEKSVLNEIAKLAYLRVLYLSNTGIRNIPSTMGKLKHLRFLDLSRNSITEPNSISSISNLKQLRFLDLSENMITTLPDSITTLYNLESLNLQCCRLLQELPEGLHTMSSLTNLDISGCDRLACMPQGLGRLSSLQRLPLFVVSEKPEHTIKELKNLNQIKGCLRIEGLQNVQDQTEAIAAELGAKADLPWLELCWNRKGEAPPPSRDEDRDILEGLQPHPVLKCLKIENYNLDRFPDWLMKMDTLLNLEELSLHNLRSSGYLPPVSQLPSLKRLYIGRMDAVKSIGTEFFGDAGTFHRLEHLVLCDLPNLKEWIVPADGAMFPRLKSMEISWCPNLTVRTCLPPSIEKLTMVSSNEELLGLGAGGGLRGLSRVKKLTITGFGASKFRWEGLQYLTALEELTISCCPKLTCLPKGVLQLQFPSLHTLELELNTKLSSLGEGGEEPPAFATSLQHLIVRGCGALKSLPKWVSPQMLQQPSNSAWWAATPPNIKQLTIDFCHVLRKRNDDCFS